MEKFNPINNLEQNGEFKLFVFDFGTMGKIVTRGRNEDEAKIAMFHDLSRNSPMYGSTYHIQEVDKLPQDIKTKIKTEYEKTHPDYKFTKPRALE